MEAVNSVGNYRSSVPARRRLKEGKDRDSLYRERIEKDAFRSFGSRRDKDGLRDRK